jgi:hypothetical protein
MLVEKEHFVLRGRTRGEFELVVDVIFVDGGEEIDSFYEAESYDDAKRWVNERGGVIINEPEATISDVAKTFSDLRGRASNATTYHTGLPDRELDKMIGEVFDDQRARVAAQNFDAVEHYSSHLQHTLGLVSRLLPTSKVEFKTTAQNSCQFGGNVDHPTAAWAKITNGETSFNAHAINLSLALIDCLLQMLISMEGNKR